MLKLIAYYVLCIILISIKTSFLCIKNHEIILFNIKIQLHYYYEIFPLTIKARKKKMQIGKDMNFRYITYVHIIIYYMLLIAESIKKILSRFFLVRILQDFIFNPNAKQLKFIM